MKYVIRISDDDGFSGYHGPAPREASAPQWAETQHEAQRFESRQAAEDEIAHFGCGCKTAPLCPGGEYCEVVRLKPRERVSR